MSKRFLILAIAITLLAITGCQGASPAVNGGNGEGGGNDGGSVQEERNADGDIVFRGEVKSLESDRYIVVYINNAVTQEIYHVLISDQTVFTDANGSSIGKDQINVGDRVEIGFSGQVMMSYPPQIAAKSIKIL